MLRQSSISSLRESDPPPVRRRTVSEGVHGYSERNKTNNFSRVRNERNTTSTASLNAIRLAPSSKSANNAPQYNRNQPRDPTDPSRDHWAHPRRPRLYTDTKQLSYISEGYHGHDEGRPRINSQTKRRFPREASRGYDLEANANYPQDVTEYCDSIATESRPQSRADSRADSRPVSRGESRPESRGESSEYGYAEPGYEKPLPRNSYRNVLANKTPWDTFKKHIANISCDSMHFNMKATSSKGSDVLRNIIAELQPSPQNKKLLDIDTIQSEQAEVEIRKATERNVIHTERKEEPKILNLRLNATGNARPATPQSKRKRGSTINELTLEVSKEPASRSANKSEQYTIEGKAPNKSQEDKVEPDEEEDTWLYQTIPFPFRHSVEEEVRQELYARYVHQRRPWHGDRLSLYEKYKKRIDARLRREAHQRETELRQQQATRPASSPAKLSTSAAATRGAHVMQRTRANMKRRPMSCK